MLARFGEPSRSRMRAKINADRAAVRDQAGETTTEQADATARHTYHEFVVGLHLQRAGLQPEYNCKLDGKTSDWFDERARLLLEVFTCERGGTTAVPARVASRIAGKVRKYAETVRRHGLCFVVAVYGDTLSGLAAAGCEEAIHNGQLFVEHRELSGVIYFAQLSGMNHTGAYAFTYFANPQAYRPIELRL